MHPSLATENSGPDRTSSGPGPQESFNAAGFALALDQMLRGELQPSFHYQPIVDLRRGVPAGYEALARFPASMGGVPDVCFAAAAAIGKRLDLEDVLIRGALIGKALLPPDCFLSVNISPTLLISQQWQRILHTLPDLTNIVLEVTEEESILNYVRVRARLDQVRSLGGSIAVDDAGSGFAGMQQIVEMKPSFIKLDRSLIKNCHCDRAKSVLIEMLGRASSRLDAWIVAEGIETELELNELIQLGAPLGQGYHLGRPHPVMLPLQEDRANGIRARNFQYTPHERLAPHVEPCPVRATAEEARHLLRERRAETVVVLDSWKRPLHIFEHHPVLGLRCLTGLMKTQIAGDPAEVLQRALTRPAESRFDPFAVISSQGVFQGIVRVDRLMSALLDAGPLHQ